MIRQLRLGSGIVMFLYVVTHFVNHSLGLVSVQVMDRALQRSTSYWASQLGTLALYGAFSIHYGLALWALWQRRSLRMPAAEATQLVLGFSHPVPARPSTSLQTRVADTFFGARLRLLLRRCSMRFFVISPWRGVLQLSVLVDRLDPRHDRLALLARAQAVVSALAAGPLRLCAAAADPGDSGLCRRRPRGHGVGADPALGRAASQQAHPRAGPGGRGRSSISW